jgi:hypothetical protein
MREPQRTPPSSLAGLPRRILRRSKEQPIGYEEAQAWARAQAWFGNVVSGCSDHPYNTRSCYFWILKS